MKFSDFANLSRFGMWHGSIANMGTSVIYCEDKLNTWLGKNSFAPYINNDRAEPALVKGGYCVCARNIEALSNLYVDKEQWLFFFPLVLQEHGLQLSEHPSSHYDTWLRWRDPFLATTSWFRAALFDYAPETSGWLELTFCGTVHSVLEQFIPRLLMLHGDLFVVQLLCPATVVALHGSHIHNLQRLPQLSLESIRDGWALHVTSL